MFEEEELPDNYLGALAALNALNKQFISELERPVVVRLPLDEADARASLIAKLLAVALSTAPPNLETIRRVLEQGRLLLHGLAWHSGAESGSFENN